MLCLTFFPFKPNLFWVESEPDPEPPLDFGSGSTIKGGLRDVVSTSGNLLVLHSYKRVNYLSLVFIQWFYFRVENMRHEVEYKFSIVNFTKPDSQYAVGMRPVLYSQREAETSGIGRATLNHSRSFVLFLII